MKRIFSLILTVVLIAGSALNAKAANIEEPFKVYTTAYCQGTTTHTGVPVRAGVISLATGNALTQDLAVTLMKMVLEALRQGK